MSRGWVRKLLSRADVDQIMLAPIATSATRRAVRRAVHKAENRAARRATERARHAPRAMSPAREQARARTAARMTSRQSWWNDPPRDLVPVTPRALHVRHVDAYALPDPKRSEPPRTGCGAALAVRNDAPRPDVLRRRLERAARLGVDVR